MSKYTYLTCVLSFVFVMSAPILSAQSAPASPTVQTTATIGLADGEIARLNLLNPGVLPPATGATCSVAVSFVNPAGAVLKTKSLSIPPGQSMAFDLFSDVDLGLRYGDRREIRALIATPVTTAAAATPPACKLIPNIEIFDSASGRTLVVLGRVQTVPAAPPAN